MQAREPAAAAVAAVPLRVEPRQPTGEPRTAAVDPLWSKPLSGKHSAITRALCLGERIDIKSLPDAAQTSGPPLLPVGASGYAIVFRYGCVVFVDVSRAEEHLFLDYIASRVTEPVRWTFTEEARIEVEPSGAERVTSDSVVISDRDPAKLRLLAEVLARSVVLEHYEATIADAFHEVEPLAMSLKQVGSARQRSRALVKRIGAALLAEHRLVGRVEVGDKPELLWERPELEPFYARLQEEYELRERRSALERKLELLAGTMATLLDLVHTRRSLRVEWYVVALILIEIGLSVYEMLNRG
jgi:uncharacterized Rmd1/YagE family protein